MTASDLEPTLTTTTSAGECTRHVIDRVTLPPCEPSKRVTVSGETHGLETRADEEKEANDGNNNNQCVSGASAAGVSCCRSHPSASDQCESQISVAISADETVTRYPTQVVATDTQPYAFQPLQQPHAISTYPQANNLVYYPSLASVPSQLGLPLQPHLSFYHHNHHVHNNLQLHQQAPFLTWTYPITGNYHHQLPGLSTGALLYYAQHHHQAQPFVVQHHHHHQLGGPAIYQSANATTTTTNHHNQYVTQATPPDKSANECQSHGSSSSSSLALPLPLLPPPINEISTCKAIAGTGSSAASASYDYAHCAQQTKQQYDKSAAALTPQPQGPTPETLDTTALLAAVAACGPIPHDDKRARSQSPSRPQQLNKISYLNENVNEGASQLEGVSAVEDDDDDDDEERGSCLLSSLCDDSADSQPVDTPNRRAVTTHESSGKSTSRHRHHYQKSSCTTTTSTSGGGGGGGDDGGGSSSSSTSTSACSPGLYQRELSPKPHRDQPRGNLMVEPARGGGGGSSSSSSSSKSGEDQQEQADSEEEEEEKEEEEAKGYNIRVPLLNNANLEEHQSINIINQQANAPPPLATTETHQISINGTTFYHVDPARLFLPPQPQPQPPQAIQHQHHHQQQLPLFLTYYSSYHTNHPPATNDFQRAAPQLSPYAASYQQPWYSPAPPPPHTSGNTNDRLLILQPPSISYPEWLHHAAYQQAQMRLPSHQELFASPYLGGPLRPPIHHSHDRAQTQAQVPAQRSVMEPLATVNTTSVSQLKLGYNLIPLLPIQAIPTRVRQAYGMDKVWQDEFEQLFALFVSQIVWILVEVETNPNVRASSRILDYKNRYIVRVNGGPSIDVAMISSTCASSSGDADGVSDDASEGEVEEKEVNKNKGFEEESERDGATTKASQLEEAQDGEDEVDDEDEDDSCSLNLGQSHLMNERASNCESDCDSGAVLNSSTSGSNSETTCCQVDELSNTSSNSTGPITRTGFTPMTEVGGKVESTSSQLVEGARKLPLKFRMFIDSAKVRFCCETCGHGWTSMKGRVVFWYELFELVDNNDQSAKSSAPFKYANEQQHGASNLIGYCAYKLFGQQCDVCKVENRFERPMWYPEEVTKVLCNLYNKIGQVYFGFRMPTIDKQRRAGKPKTSHNSLLCQACHDGVCTDRK